MKSPILAVLEPILGIFTFFIILTLVAYLVSLPGINAGSITVLVVRRTSFGINVLGFLALLIGVAWIFAVLRGKHQGLIVRRWTIVLGLLIALLLLRAAAVVHGGEMDTARPAQLGGISVAFVGFWLGFYGEEKRLGPQAIFVFATLTVIYWLLDLSAMPSVIDSGAPLTSFAGGGLSDSDFVYPFSAAITYVVAKIVLRLIGSALGNLESALEARHKAREPSLGIHLLLREGL